MSGSPRFYQIASSLCFVLAGGVALFGMVVQMSQPTPPAAAWATGGVLAVGIGASGLFAWMGRRAGVIRQLPLYGPDPRIVERRPMARIVERRIIEVESKPARTPEVVPAALPERQAA